MLKRIVMIVCAFFLALSLSLPEQAESAGCRGLSRGKCKARSGCVWVKSYKRKGGITVKAHCRSKTKKYSKKGKKKKIEKRHASKKKKRKYKKRKKRRTR